MKTLRIHYLQHVHFEDLGCIEDWISAKGYSLSSTKFYENNQLPGLSTFDWLIVMGGRYIQTAETMLSNAQFIGEVNKRMLHLLDFLDDGKEM
jgi:GMP synthase-like glutamine amidotransferase